MIIGRYEVLAGGTAVLAEIGERFATLVAIGVATNIDPIFIGFEVSIIPPTDRSPIVGRKYLCLNDFLVGALRNLN